MRQLSAHDAGFLYSDTSHTNSNVTLMSSGSSFCILGRADLISSMTDMVEASARFVARM